MNSSDYISDILLKYDIDTVFGIVGIPIVELAESLIAHKIKFISCRNEQSASYAASMHGALNGKPGVLLTVGGPGLIHSLAGIYNSMENNWPLIVITGSIEVNDQYKKGFQELDHISILHKYAKFTGKLTSGNIDLVFFESMRNSMIGNKGVSFIDIPGNLLHCKVETPNHTVLHQPIPLLKSSPCDDSINSVGSILRDSITGKDKEILIVIGEGSTEASSELRNFVNTFNLPFLPTPMGKGIVPDSNNLNVSSARSMAIKKADIVVVIGTSLNWLLHFGDHPKWGQNSRFIEINNNSRFLGLNNSPDLRYSLYGDISITIKKLTHFLLTSGKDIKYSGVSKELNKKISSNKLRLQEKENSITKHSNVGNTLNYNQVYAKLRSLIDDSNTIIVAEGANTMDFARISFPTDHPQQRLDCGTLATMGIGLGYAIAAKLSKPNKNVVLIQGDSAFGFSGMELETAVRNKLGLIVIIMNNSGIYHGIERENYINGDILPPTVLSEDCRYDLVGKGLGCNGYLIRTVDEVTKYFKIALDRSRKFKETSVLNVLIEPGNQGKLSFGWQSKPRL